MNTIASTTIEFVMQQIENGFMFEKFAQEIVGILDGTGFVPIGGIGDKGIDGLEFTLSSEGGINKRIYQFSIEKNPKAKIERTLSTLASNNISCERLIYVTNQPVDDHNNLIDHFFNKFQVLVTIQDLKWFTIHVNDKTQTISVFTRFSQDYLQDYQKPEKVYELIDVKDPRIYIYLRQQMDRSEYSAKLDELLVDCLIFLALDDTDPNEGILRSRQEIVSLIQELSHFDVKWLQVMVDARLKVLSSKPIRKIRHHQKDDLFCLPYETRNELAQRNLEDSQLYEDFLNSTLIFLKSELNKLSIQVKHPEKFLEQVFHTIFKQQGLEFSEFVTTGDGSVSIDKSLKLIVSELIDQSSVIPQNREPLKTALINTVRNIIYKGTESQLEFLRRLSNTYRMLFLLQFDPKLASYFEVMAGKLKIYVDTSILIPAISEYFLELPHRRYTNLLLSARNAGIQMIVNQTVISELVGHLRGVQKTYTEKYEDKEDLYDDELGITYVPEILIRAYFYAKLNEKVETFREFIEHFVSWNLATATSELVEWLSEAFGVLYEEAKNLNVNIDPAEENELFEELKKFKASDAQARTDAKQLLMIYALREANNELGNGGIFGYSTWWLTSDYNSQLAFQRIARDTQRTSPYIRADFLYNYVALAPSKSDVENIYKKVFPTLLGVNISFHVPTELCKVVQENLTAHRDLVKTPRFRGYLRGLNEQLKANPDQWDRKKIKSWFVDRATEIRDI